MDAGQILALLVVIALLFWIGKFYFEVARLLCRLVKRLLRRLAALASRGGKASPSPGGWPPFRP